MTADASYVVDDHHHSWSFRDIFYAGILYHTIPGCCMVLGGTGYLLVSLMRARSLRAGESFCARYIPEPNYTALRVISSITVMAICFMTIRQITGPCFAVDASWTCWMNQPGHVAMYGLYASVCGVALLETSSRRLLPPDSWRVAAVLCCLLNSFLMAGHANMKPTPEDVLTHELWGDLELYQALILAYSIYHTDNLASYLATWILLIVKGVWIVLAGYQLQFHSMDLETIRPVFVLLVLFVTGVTTLVGALFGNVHSSSASSPSRNRRPATEDYNHLLTTKNEAHDTTTATDDDDDAVETSTCFSGL